MPEVVKSVVAALTMVGMLGVSFAISALISKGIAEKRKAEKEPKTLAEPPLSEK